MAQPMFHGAKVNVARYDEVKLPYFDKLVEKQLSFFWRPEEVDLSKDRGDFSILSEAEQHIFVSNLQYQILLDSVQGRAPVEAFLTITSLPELENWIVTWAFSETIHSRSYTHIIRNILANPAIVFDQILLKPEIVERARDVTKDYDNLISNPSSTEALFLALASVNILEAVRFYVSFACSFNFAERELMEGNAKIIKLIARDEALHLAGTQTMLNRMLQGDEGAEVQKVALANIDKVMEMFASAAEQEKAWADYLFKDGSMLGLNANVLKEYIEYITDVRIKALGLGAIFNRATNPLPWMNHWLVSDNVQVAPQESEISSYLVGQVDTNVQEDDFKEFKL